MTFLSVNNEAMLYSQHIQTTSTHSLAYGPIPLKYLHRGAEESNHLKTEEFKVIRSCLLFGQNILVTQSS